MHEETKVVMHWPALVSVFFVKEYLNCKHTELASSWLIEQHEVVR
jgi:hypothetical protein